MGEYADMAIDDALNGWDYRERWNDPDDDEWDMFTRFTGRKDRRRINGMMRTCNTCHKPSCFFHEESPNRWILAEFDKDNKVTQHVCKFMKIGKKRDRL